MVLQNKDEGREMKLNCKEKKRARNRTRDKRVLFYYRIMELVYGVL